MLTTDLDKPGRGWNGPPSGGGLTRPVRQSWTGPDGPDLATDQKVGGSSSSERATVPAGQGPVLISGKAANDCRRACRLTISHSAKRSCESWRARYGLAAGRRRSYRVEHCRDAGVPHDLLEHL